MARKKTSLVRVDFKAKISMRLREIRQELFGEHGGPELARQLGLPARTWYNYEMGVTVPAEVLLSFIDHTGTSPIWLLTGKGPKYRQQLGEVGLEDLTPQQLIRRGLEKLESQQEQTDLASFSSRASFQQSGDAYCPIGLVPIAAMVVGNDIQPQEQILALRDWVPNPSKTIAVLIEDDAMHPVLAAGSVAIVDRTVREPLSLQGRLVAACPDGIPMIRWLEISGRHLILRPNQPSLSYPIVPTEWQGDGDGHGNGGNPLPIVGQVIWSWSRFPNI